MSSRSHCAERLLLAALLLGAGCRTQAAALDAVQLRIVVPDADADADVYVDGLYVGQARALGSERLGTIKLAPGVHRVEVRKAGRFPVQRTIRVDGDTPAEVVVDGELLEDPV